MISNVYSYYMSEYGSRQYNRHDSHRRSELRAVYNNIVKINRTRPFCKVDFTEDSQRYVIDVKESAIALFDVTEDLTDVSNGNMTFKNIAYSNNEDVLHVEHIGADSPVGTSASFKVAVKQLATPQVNTGQYLSPRARSLYSGTYSIDVDISTLTYELQFNVKDDDTNLDVQNKLTRLINKSNIGIKAAVITNEDNKNAIELTSNMTGIGDKPIIFTVSDSENSALTDAAEILGLNNTTHYPSNSVFELNGNTKISSSNVFTVDKTFEIKLKNVNKEDEYVTVGLKQDYDALIDNFNELTSRYNKLLSVAQNGNTTGSKRLYSELSAITNSYADDLDSNGIHIDKNGLLHADREKLQEISDNGQILNTLSKLNKFKNSLAKHVNNIMINPMEYIDKLVVSYKNPIKPSTDPYTISIFSGMLFNGYC